MNRETWTCPRCKDVFRIGLAPSAKSERGRCGECLLAHWSTGDEHKPIRVGMDRRPSVSDMRPQRRVA